MSLSYRLQSIASKITQHYDHIWDTCCDHGYLGMALLSRFPSSTIHFVDISPPIIENVQNNLTAQSSTHPPLPLNWLCHTISVNTLPLNQYSGNHLIVIAGVGGDLVAEFVHKLTIQHPNSELEFILCPVHHTYRLREQLIALNYALIDESLICDNTRFYEIIHITNNTYKGSQISPVGDILWQTTTASLRQQYLTRLIRHYQNVSQRHSRALIPLNSYRLLANSLK